VKILRLSKFKKKFHLTQKQVNELARLGKILIQQNGYRGHILRHHKIVVYNPGSITRDDESDEPIPVKATPVENPEKTKFLELLEQYEKNEIRIDYSHIASELLWEDYSNMEILYISKHLMDFAVRGKIPDWLKELQDHREMEKVFAH